MMFNELIENVDEIKKQTCSTATHNSLNSGMYPKSNSDKNILPVDIVSSIWSSALYECRSRLR